VAGYFGGWVDTGLQALMDTFKTTPITPLFMSLAAFIPVTCSAAMRFAFIAMILGLLCWGTLARQIRTHILAERTADYVLSAKIERRRHRPHHPAPSSIAVTSFSFIGLGRKDPVNSRGVMLQNTTRVDVLLN